MPRKEMELNRAGILPRGVDHTGHGSCHFIRAQLESKEVKVIKGRGRLY